MAKQILDGCTAATHVAFAMSDVATIYPITPIASMGETAQQWGRLGRKNYMGVAMRVEELESELGAAGATHGALAAGSLATTFTSSQGLLLMIPNMYKMAGNQLPAVFHVGTRTVATHALSIFGDHSDIMAARATGFAFLASNSVQETMDMALVAHLAAIDGSVPVCHFMDGWRTSNQMDTIDVIPYDTMFSLIDRDKVAAFRARALNPEHPSLAGSAQNPDVFFQNAEAQNPFYAAFPAVVQRQMDRVAAVTGRHFHLFDYYGAPQPEAVIVAMGSACEVIAQTVDRLNADGYNVGLVKVRLFRPFSGEALMKAIPDSVKVVAVLDRTREAGADGEPLFKDVATAAVMAGRGAMRIIGGRYGLASKDFTPAMVKAVYDMALTNPRHDFTVGITDDVTFKSLVVPTDFRLSAACKVQAIFYGMGSDGTVGATKQAANILGNADNLYAQAYFHYSAKKSGGYTVSELRLADHPIRADYSIDQADYVGCNNHTYVKKYRLADKLRRGGTLVINCPWQGADVAECLPPRLRRVIAQKQINLYIIDAQKIAKEVGLGFRVNMIMETVFFHLTNVIPFDKAIAALKAEIQKTYIHEGGDVVEKNFRAVDSAVAALQRVDVPAEWADAPLADSDAPSLEHGIPVNTVDFFKRISEPCLRLEGNGLPVSMFTPDGRMPMGTTAFEKRCFAIDIPQWDPDKCVECAECSLVCAHAAIRPYLLDDEEMAKAPANFTTRQGEHIEAFKPLHYRIQVYPEDCTGCGSCAIVCPGHALTMVPIATQLEEQKPLLEFAQQCVSLKPHLAPRFTIDGSQLQQPLMEFSGACAGCGETPYVKLLTQLFGERMIIANATGCSSIWGANYPSNAYCVRQADGRGPAWGNSLFEDNAEYAYGMAVSCRQRRQELRTAMEQAIADAATPAPLAEAMKQWIAQMAEPKQSQEIGLKIVALIKELPAEAVNEPMQVVLRNADMLGKKSVWAIGGDGWAYDIGFAGLDHVLASGEDVNILVMDTECYSNTGGQMSKATPLGAVTKYSVGGKRTYKKDLGRMMMTYGTVYVASIALGANFQQTIDAMREAEAYPGPSILIAYCPCILHGIRKGMGNSIIEERLAVESGYWDIYRFNPIMAQRRLPPYIADEVDALHSAPASTDLPVVGPDGLPVDSAPTAAENADALTAAEGPWDAVAPELSTLTVDWPLQKPAASGASTADASATVGGTAATRQATEADSLFPLDKLNAFLDGEDRYADIYLNAPDLAPTLRSELNARNRLVHTLLTGLENLL